MKHPCSCSCTLGAAVAVLASLATAALCANRCPRLVRAVDVGDRAIYRTDDGSALVFEAGMSIDADGAPTAYHPDDRGLDRLANAGRPGRWWALVTDTGRPDGRPIVQGPDDPAPGFHVSTTSLVDPGFARTDPRRYVDATRVPFIVLPNLPPVRRQLGVRLGDLAVVRYRGRQAFAVFADLGPRVHLGEGSVALAAALGIAADPRRGGVRGGVTYVVLPGSGDGRPHPAEEIAQRARRRYEAWGGDARLEDCLRQR